MIRGRPSAGRRVLTASRLIALRVAAIWLVAAAAALDVAAQSVADEEYVGPLVNQALETEQIGVELPWSNPATGGSGVIVIERTFYRDPRTPCRDYRRTLERPGAPTVEIRGTGCRIGDGRWSLDEEEPAPVAASPAPVTGPGPAPAEPPAFEPGRAAAAPPSCPSLSVVPVPCSKPPAVVDYTLPTRTEL